MMWMMFLEPKKNVDKIDTLYVCVFGVFSFYYITKWLSHSRLGRYSAVQFIGMGNGGTNGVNENLLSLFFLFFSVSSTSSSSKMEMVIVVVSRKRKKIHFISLSYLDT